MWQPIETAPKDGKQYLFHHSSGTMHTASWSENFEEWMITGQCGSMNFTHWQPLPEPP